MSHCSMAPATSVAVFTNSLYSFVTFHFMAFASSLRATARPFLAMHGVFVHDTPQGCLPQADLCQTSCCLLVRMSCSYHRDNAHRNTSLRSSHSHSLFRHHSLRQYRRSGHAWAWR